VGSLFSGYIRQRGRRGEFEDLDCASIEDGHALARGRDGCVAAIIEDWACRGLEGHLAGSRVEDPDQLPLDVVAAEGRESADGVGDGERLLREPQAVGRVGQDGPDRRFPIQIAPKDFAAGGDGDQFVASRAVAGRNQDLLLGDELVGGRAGGVDAAQNPAAAGEEVQVQHPLLSPAAQALQVALGVDGQVDGGANAADQQDLAGVEAQDAHHPIGRRLGIVIAA